MVRSQGNTRASQWTSEVVKKRENRNRNTDQLYYICKLWRPWEDHHHNHPFWRILQVPLWSNTCTSLDYTMEYKWISDLERERLYDGSQDTCCNWHLESQSDSWTCGDTEKMGSYRLYSKQRYRGVYSWADRWWWGGSSRWRGGYAVTNTRCNWSHDYVCLCYHLTCWSIGARRVPLLSPTMSKHDSKKKKHPRLDNIRKALTKFDTDLENHKHRW